jgi:7-carboxy-7-deazaguanine synthase
MIGAMSITGASAAAAEMSAARVAKMLVMEIYRSVQGEGTLMGVNTTFVRFFACNLRCSWCDTKFSWSLREGGSYQEMTPGEVLRAVEEQSARHVVLTGGEPSLQRELPALSRLLAEAGFHVTVETAVTVFPAAALPHVALWSLSPKLPSAGAGYLRQPVIGRFLSEVPRDHMQWKFVLRDDADEHALRTLLEQQPAFRREQLPIILQPEADSAAADYPAALEALVTRIRAPFWGAYHVRVLPQMHFLIWGSRRRV